MSRRYIREAEITYRRSAEVIPEARSRVRTSADLVPTIQAVIGSRMAESLLAVALDAKNSVVGYHECARGSVSSCAVLPVDILRYPVAIGAASFVLAHNHPSGDASPSSEDVAMTARVAEGAKLLGIRLLDHIIVTEDSYSSMCDLGMLP